MPDHRYEPGAFDTCFRCGDDKLGHGSPGDRDRDTRFLQAAALQHLARGHETLNSPAALLDTLISDGLIRARSTQPDRYVMTQKGREFLQHEAARKEAKPL